MADPIFLTPKDHDIVKAMVRQEMERRLNTRTRRRRHVTGGGSGEGLTLLRLEEDLCQGGTAEARVMECSGITLEGAVVVVRDVIGKAFSRGTPAPMGDDGGDSQGDASLIYGTLCESEYHFVSGGTYYKHIEGFLAADQGTNAWRVDIADIAPLQGGDGEFIYGDTDGATYIDLEGICNIVPADGAYFQAIALDCGPYKITAYCCVG